MKRKIKRCSIGGMALLLMALVLVAGQTGVKEPWLVINNVLEVIVST